MKLYHGSLDIVEHPKIRRPNRTLDYGNGFYTTTSFEQAEDWVRRRMNEFQTAKGFVNVYELFVSIPLLRLTSVWRMKKPSFGIMAQWHCIKI